MNNLLADPVLLLVAVLTLVLGVGRLARAITYDDFPPAVWIRMTWDTITHDGPWSKLAHCQWCLSPWITAVAVGWYALGTIVPWVAIAWWIVWGILALAYVASIIVGRDEQRD